MFLVGMCTMSNNTTMTLDWKNYSTHQCHGLLWHDLIFIQTFLWLHTLILVAFTRLFQNISWWHIQSDSLLFDKEKILITIPSTFHVFSMTLHRLDFNSWQIFQCAKCFNFLLTPICSRICFYFTLLQARPWLKFCRLDFHYIKII
jgi:hypothetical protein